MFGFTIVHRHELDRRAAGQLANIARKIDMISAEVQKILDQAKQNTSLVKSVDLGLKGLQAQVAEMQARIDALPSGNVLSDDDKAALAEASNELASSITTLQSDIPANTNTGNAQGGQALDPDGKPATGGTPGSAKPLEGTGQS